MTGPELARFLAGYRFRLGHEDLLQRDVRDVMERAGIPFEREFVFNPGDRVDFFVDGHIALELKIKMQQRRIFRQLERYAMDDRVDSLVLMTLGAGGIPPAINGKPCYVVNLGRTTL